MCTGALCANGQLIRVLAPPHHGALHKRHHILRQCARLIRQHALYLAQLLVEGGCAHAAAHIEVVIPRPWSYTCTHRQ